jgi:glucose/arabinose dehydrogenase
MASFSRLYLVPIFGIIISLLLFFVVAQQRGEHPANNISNNSQTAGNNNTLSSIYPANNISNNTNSQSQTAGNNNTLSSIVLPPPPHPSLKYSSLEIQTIFKGLDRPTQMAFLGPNDILILQKNDGKVLRIKNCGLEPEVVLNVTVSTRHERGLLGIALSNTQQEKTNAFVFYTEPRLGDNGVVNATAAVNSLYRYEFEDGRLVNPELIFRIDASMGAIHNGGVMTIGPDNNVYLVIGDIAGHKTLTQNYLDTSESDGTSTILRFTQEGESAGPILGTAEPTNKFYAYGIRNSFGMDFDHVTGNLWDTENGHAHNDEINLVEPGFNSGWGKISGFQFRNSSFDPEKSLVNCLYCNTSAPGPLDKGMKDGRYSDPEFVWSSPVGVTALKFLNSDKLGKHFENDMFVADIMLGAIYRFELNEKRDGLLLEDALMDRIADSSNELAPITFAQGFGGITDLEVGPDGYLYILSYTGYRATTNDEDAIYRVVPKGTPQPC